MCETLRASHYHHHWLQQRHKGVISKVQMRRGSRCGCRSSRDRGGGGIVTRHTERESATVTLVTVVESSHFMCSETHSDSEVSLVIKPFPLASPHQGAASRGNRVKIIDEDVSRSIFILMHRDILVNVENQSMWPSKWD